MISGGTRGGLKPTLVTAAVVLLVACAFTGVVLFVGKANGIEFWELSQDPASVLGGPYFTGFYANATILVWQIGAMTALFAAVITRFAGRRAESRMLLVGGVIGAVMGIDDFFMLHESLQEIGLPDFALPGLYFLSVIAFAWFYRQCIGWWLVFVLGAFGGWGTSAMVDNLHMGLPLVFEDGTKAIGAVFWSVLLIKLAYRAVTECITVAEASDEYGIGEDQAAADEFDAMDLPAPVALRRSQPAPVSAPYDDPATTPIPIIAPPRGVRPRPDLIESANAATTSMRPRAMPVRSAPPRQPVGRPRHRSGDDD